MRTLARQRVLFCCRCGESRLYAARKCLPCYSRDKRNERHYAGLREEVLKRDGYRCCTCRFTPSAEEENRLLVVHHCQPGVSELHRMLTLCAACHARVERTKFLKRDVSNLVRELWRELHPQAHEQTWLPLALSPESTREAL